MNFAALPRWATALLLFILFAVVPAVSHLLDGPTEIDAARAAGSAGNDIEREFSTPAKDAP